MATQGNGESGRSRETGDSSRRPGQVRDLINVVEDAIAGSEERQSRDPGGSGHHAHLEIKQISGDNLKSQKQCAALFLAASKLKHEVSFLSDALEIFGSFFELKKCKSGKIDAFLHHFIIASKLSLTSAETVRY